MQQNMSVNMGSKECEDDIVTQKRSKNCLLCHTNPSCNSQDELNQITKIPTDLELNSEGLVCFEPKEKKLLAILPKNVTRHQHDKKYLCIEYEPQAGLGPGPHVGVGPAVQDKTADSPETGPKAGLQERLESGIEDEAQLELQTASQSTAQIGPNVGPKCVFLCFSSSQDADDWEEAIRKLIGQSIQGRGRSRTEGTRNQLKTALKAEHRKTAPSFGFGAQEPKDDDEPLLSLPNSLTSQDEGWENALRDLRRERDEFSIMVEFKKEDLLKMELRVVAYKGKFYIVSWKDRICNLNICDCIMEVDSAKPLGEREFYEYIQKLPKDTVSMKIQRFPQGNVYSMQLRRDGTSSHALGMELNGSEITQMYPDYEIRQICDPCWVWFENDRSNRSITAINDRRVPFDAETQEVEDMLNEVIREEPNLVLQLHPTNFIRNLTIAAKDSDQGKNLNSVSRRAEHSSPSSSHEHTVQLKTPSGISEC